MAGVRDRSGYSRDRAQLSCEQILNIHERECVGRKTSGNCAKHRFITAQLHSPFSACSTLMEWAPQVFLLYRQQRAPAGPCRRDSLFLALTSAFSCSHGGVEVCMVIPRLLRLPHTVNPQACGLTALARLGTKLRQLSLS